MGAVGLWAVLRLSHPEVLRFQQSEAGDKDPNCGRTGFQRETALPPPALAASLKRAVTTPRRARRAARR